ncbi:MAG: hypothetical protein Kow0069_38060 [Promethearchaeota archaeon]
MRKILKKFPLYGLISRDSYTHMKYSDLSKFSYDGLDSATFISNSFEPSPIELPPFDIETFDSISPRRVNHGDRLVIRTHHSCWPLNLKDRYFLKPNTLISDLPGDYLSLLARVHTIFSDRIHACIPALAFGNKAQLFLKERDKRLLLFQRMGVPDIYKRPVRADTSWLEGEKLKEIEFLRDIIVHEPSSRGVGSPREREPRTMTSVVLPVKRWSWVLLEVIDSILTQTSLDLKLHVFDLSDGGEVESVFGEILDGRLFYCRVKADEIITRLQSLPGDYLAIISPVVNYKPYFIYELSIILQENPDACVAFSNYVENGRVVDVRENFFKKGKLGPCFLIRKNAFQDLGNSLEISLSNGEVVVAVRNAESVHIPRALGECYKKRRHLGGTGSSILSKMKKLLAKLRNIMLEFIKDR